MQLNIIGSTRRNRGLLFILLVLQVGACSAGPTSVDQLILIETPVFDNSPYTIVREVLFTLEPDSIWGSEGHIGTRSYKYVIPSEYDITELSNVAMDAIVLGYDIGVNEFILENHNNPSFDFEWSVFRGIGVFRAFPYYIPMPDTLNIDDFISARTLYARGENLLGAPVIRFIRIKDDVDLYQPHWSVKRIIFTPPGSPNPSLCLLYSGEIWEVSDDNKWLFKWPGVIPHRYVTTTFYNEDLLYYESDGTLNLLSRLDNAPRTLATGDTIGFSGITVIGNKLYALKSTDEDPGILFTYDLISLIETGDFSTIKPHRTQLNFIVNGPLHHTANGLLLCQGMTSSTIIDGPILVPGNKGITIFDENGLPFGIWTLPVEQIRNLHIGEDYIWVSASLIKSNALNFYHRFEDYGSYSKLYIHPAPISLTFHITTNIPGNLY